MDPNEILTIGTEVMITEKELTIVRVDADESSRADTKPAAIARNPSQGATTNLESTESNVDERMIARSRSQLIESFEFVPNEDKAAYLEAMQRAPHLVELESNPDHHLEYTGYDPWKTARRLATYWKTRVDLFGEERAFLPMTINGDGAMSSEDIDVLNTGFLMVLPEDGKGRAVVFHDRARLTNREFLDNSKRLRCFFYILSTIAENEKSRRLGIVIISSYAEKTRHQTLDNLLHKDGAFFLESEVFPLRVVQGHVVMLSQKPILRKALSIVVQILKKIPVIVHNPASTEQLIQELTQVHGFQLEGIPKVPFGGLFTIGCFREWIEDRHRREAKIYGTISGTTEDDVCDDTAKARKRRELVAATARRRRAQKQNEVKAMQEQVELLRRQNQELRKTNENLETQLKDACTLVVESWDNCSPQRSTPTVGLDGVQNALSTNYQSDDASLLPHVTLQCQVDDGLAHELTNTNVHELLEQANLEQQVHDLGLTLRPEDMELSNRLPIGFATNMNNTAADHDQGASLPRHQIAPESQLYDDLQARVSGWHDARTQGNLVSDVSVMTRSELQLPKYPDSSFLPHEPAPQHITGDDFLALAAGIDYSDELMKFPMQTNFSAMNRNESTAVLSHHEVPPSQFHGGLSYGGDPFTMTIQKPIEAPRLELQHQEAKFPALLSADTLSRNDLSQRLDLAGAPALTMHQGPPVHGSFQSPGAGQAIPIGTTLDGCLPNTLLGNGIVQPPHHMLAVPQEHADAAHFIVQGAERDSVNEPTEEMCQQEQQSFMQQLYEFLSQSS